MLVRRESTKAMQDESAHAKQKLVGKGCRAVNSKSPAGRGE